MNRLKFLFCLFLCLGLVHVSLAPAANPQTGASGMSLPRFVSLKSDRVNVRQGPSHEHEIAWIYLKAGLPVEITAEFETWRRIRDSEGTEGWVQQALLSGRRTALVAPWGKGQMFDLVAKPNDGAFTRARVESGVILSIKHCDGSFCRVEAEGTDGYIKQDLLWGVYPNEKVE